MTFSKLRDPADDFVYVDKTAILSRLVESGGYYFLSRPRRFGKSVMLSTLHELFAGNRELFAGLAIEDRWDWSARYPVIRISFGVSGHGGAPHLRRYRPAHVALSTLRRPVPSICGTRNRLRGKAFQANTVGRPYDQIRFGSGDFRTEERFEG